MIWAYIAGSILIAIVSWFDDLNSLAVHIRLGVHIVAAIIVIVGIGFWQQLTFPVLGTLSLGWFGALITLFWIVGMTNIYNFMDGIDGLAGSQAVVAGLAWSILAWHNNHSLLLSLSLFVAIASIGFLRYNWPPASIFMGDVGSAFLGYTFAVLAVVGGQHHTGLGVAGILILWPFCFDGGFTIVRRWLRGENVMAAHRSHLYQRLVIAGFSHRTVTLIYAGLALLGALLTIGWEFGVPFIENLILIVLPLAAVGLVLFVTFQERNSNHKLPRLTTLETH